MTQALYNKWRPRNWDQIIGQPHVVETLRNAIIKDRVVHAYLFAGPRGTGKTTAARLLAKAVNCQAEDPTNRPCNECSHCTAINESRYLDLIEIDAASQTGVDDVRDLRDKVNFIPNQGKYKIYIIDEVHMFSNSAFNALLKTLEEPPAHAIFILATTEIHKIPATVLSRCQRYEFRRLPVSDIVKQLEAISSSEKIQADRDALLLIARQSSGGMRDAISLLDQMASTSKQITLELTQTVLGTATSQTVLELADALKDRQAAKGMQAIHAALDAGSDPRQLARQMVDYLRSLLMISMGNGSQVDLASDARTTAEAHAQEFSQEKIVHLIKCFSGAAMDARSGWQPSLPLEMALAEGLNGPEESQKQIQGKHSPDILYQSANDPQRVGIQPQAKADTAIQQPANQGKMDQPTKEASPLKPTQGDLARISQGWKQIYAEINKTNKLFGGLFNSSKPLEIKNNVLTIGFNSEINRSKAEKPDQVELVRKAIKDLFNLALEIKCVVAEGKKSIPDKVRGDGMVAAAIKQGGEIVDIQE